MDCPRIVIAGTQSGVGKTSLTLAIVTALRKRGLKVQTLKVGPDFACRALGIDEEFIIAKRGPFSVDKNRSVMEWFGAGVLVTKDSGPAGGTPEKRRRPVSKAAPLLLSGDPMSRLMIPLRDMPISSPPSWLVFLCKTVLKHSGV